MNVLSKLVAIIVLSFAVAVPALAWDGIKGGTVKDIHVADPASGPAYQVSLTPTVAMCSGSGNTTAYLNTTDPNYAAYVANLAIAKATKTGVSVYSNLVGTSCHIGYIVFNP